MGVPAGGDQELRAEDDDLTGHAGDRFEATVPAKRGSAAWRALQNETAFKKFQPAVRRLLDNDGFFVSNPGFKHCSNANINCAWRKVG